MGELAAILEELRQREEAIINLMVDCDTKKGRMGLRERWLEIRELRTKLSKGNYAVSSNETEVAPRQR